MFGSSTSRGKLGKRPQSSSSGLSNRAKKRAAEEEEEIHRYILFTVKNETKEVCFKINRETKLQKSLKKFCDIAGVKYSSMRFIIDGTRFPLTATPDELDMCDGDKIQAMEWHCWGD